MGTLEEKENMTRSGREGELKRQTRLKQWGRVGGIWFTSVQHYPVTAKF